MAPIEAEEPAKDEGNEEKEEDTPQIKELKELDDKYLELVRECEKEVQAVQRRFRELQTPVLEQRAEMLIRGDADANTGTPAVSGFWLQAMQNHSSFQEEIEEWDSPVLEYVQDMILDYLDPEDQHKGYKLTFKFADNPYFDNKTLWKEYHTEEDSPYTGEIRCNEVRASKIDWKAGKDITMEIVKKKPKGGGAKKAKQVKEKKEPRNSFFRNFFTNLKANEPVPDDFDRERIRELCEDSEEEDDEERVMENLLDADYEMGCALRDNIVPFAVRWYTGEAAPEENFDEDEEEEDSEEEDEEEDDEDDEDEEEERGRRPPPGRRGKGKSGGGAAPGSRGAAKAAPKASSDAPADGEGKSKEECKQQ